MYNNNLPQGRMNNYMGYMPVNYPYYPPQHPHPNPYMMNYPPMNVNVNNEPVPVIYSQREEMANIIAGKIEMSLSQIPQKCSDLFGDKLSSHLKKQNKNLTDVKNKMKKTKDSFNCKITKINTFSEDYVTSIAGIEGALKESDKLYEQFNDSLNRTDSERNTQNGIYNSCEIDLILNNMTENLANLTRDVVMSIKLQEDNMKDIQESLLKRIDELENEIKNKSNQRCEKNKNDRGDLNMLSSKLNYLNNIMEEYKLYEINDEECIGITQNNFQIKKTRKNINWNSVISQENLNNTYQTQNIINDMSFTQPVLKKIITNQQFIPQNTHKKRKFNIAFYDI